MNNYPIKYAILGLTVNGGWINNYEDKTIGYIVSKCYVLDTTVKYKEDGTYSIKHNVFFPYNNFDYFSNTNKDQRINNIYKNATVNKLYDSYSAANIDATNKNIELEQKIYSKLSLIYPNWKDEYSKLKNEFYNYLYICKKYEDYILNNTYDMKISENKVKELYLK